MDINKCLKCEYRRFNSCTLMMNLYIGDMEKCIFDYSYIKELDKSSKEYYTFVNFPKVFHILHNKFDNVVPKNGDVVIALKSGFGGSQGKILVIDNIVTNTPDAISSGTRYHLRDLGKRISNSHRGYYVYGDNWMTSFMIMENK